MNLLGTPPRGSDHVQQITDQFNSNLVFEYSKYVQKNHKYGYQENRNTKTNKQTL
jgi:hypothetical protein